MNKVLYESPLGTLLIAEENGFLREISFFSGNEKILQNESRLTLETKMQLTEYFALKRKAFDLPVRLVGTDFSRAVWKELQNIPYSSARTYSQIASFVGNPSASRAVGLACHSNPIAIVIPCHRVIGVNGKLVGYSAGLERKRQLLRLEGIKV